MPSINFWVILPWSVESSKEESFSSVDVKIYNITCSNVQLHNFTLLPPWTSNEESFSLYIHYNFFPSYHVCFLELGLFLPLAIFGAMMFLWSKDISMCFYVLFLCLFIYLFSEFQTQRQLHDLHLNLLYNF